MPFNYAHALLALEASEAVGPSAAALIRAAEPAYRAGAMGPDPYFADDMPPPLLKKSRAALAGRLHALDAGELFAALLPLADSPIKRAYALGMLCHFTLDANAHAYIFARFPGKRHTPGEMHMDLPFMDTRPGAKPDARPPAFFRLSRAALAEIDALHADLARALFGEDSAGAFARSYRKWVGFISRITFDPGGRKRRFFGALEGLVNKPGAITAWLVTRDPQDGAADIMNLSRKPWAAPWAPDAPRNESFPALYEAALLETAPLLDCAAAGFASGDFSEALARLFGRCMNGRPLL